MAKTNGNGAAVSEDVQIGYCECGCGEKTSIAPYTVRARGWEAGKPLRFLRGHSTKGRRMRRPRGGRIQSHGYTLVRDPEHPRSGARRYVREHILNAERALGRPLPDGAVVHHVNGNRSDNRNRNLVICQDQAYHMLLERRTRALEACGHASWMKCRFCGRYDDTASPAMYVHPKGSYAHHRACDTSYARSRYVSRKETA